jgi:hypothetical protein
MFHIKNKEKAILFWKDYAINRNKKFHDGCRHNVYL